jgi:tRNA G18 (ribose-2'-O)-methylase SpoU
MAKIKDRDDQRNVVDFYRYWKEEAIKADLRTKHHNFSVLVKNEIKDFNLGTLIRCSNAFCATQVIVYGSKQYDRRGTVGAHLYTDIKHLKFTDNLKESLPADSIIIGVDNIPSAVPVETFEWPKDKHVIMVFGQEDVGITEDLLSLCDHLVYIKQYGSVRSLNVGCASAIVMYDYCRKIIDGNLQ